MRRKEKGEQLSFLVLSIETDEGKTDELKTDEGFDRNDYDELDAGKEINLKSLN